MKFNKFEVVKKVLDDIVEDYKEAKENDDEKKMASLQIEYEELKKVMWSSYNYVKNDVNAVELYFETKKDNIEEYKKAQNEILLGQRTLYLSNRVTVNNVENSETIEDYMKKDSKKALNFVKRNFGKLALGAAAAVTILTLSLTGCSNKDKNKEQSITQTNTETTMESTKDTEKTENKEQSTENVVVKTENGYVKLNELPEFEDNNSYTETTDKNNGNNANVEKNANSNGVKFTYNNETFKKEVKEEALDPHVTNDGKKTTTTTVVKETTVKEKEAVDYNTKTTDNTKTNDKEKVTIIEKEETKEVNTTNIPIEGVKEEKPVDYKPTTKDEDFIPTEEKITIIEVEEKVDINQNIEVEDNKTTYQKVKENNDKEVVIYEEKEEKIEVNTDNLPIVEGKAKTLAYRM